MISAPLARDEDGNPFELPDSAALWQIKKVTGGRPATVLGPDDRQLYIAIVDDEDALRANGCSGDLRLEAMDEQRRKVGAPFAFVHLEALVADVRGSASRGDSDLTRATVDANTRAMESMQRTQVEQIRAAAQRERALLEAQVAIQQSHTELVIALLDRMAPSEKQEPVTLLKRQLEFQRVLSQAAQRNALPASGTISEQDRPAEEDELVPGWLKKVASFAPTVQESIVTMFAKGDPAKAESLRAGIGTFTNLVTSIANMGNASASSPPTAPSVRHRPKAIREILALLEEDEAQAMDRIIDGLDDANFQRLCLEAAAITLDERVARARATLAAVGFVRTSTQTVEAPDVDEPPDVPAALQPIFARLSPEEVSAGEEMLSILDLSTVNRMIAELTAVPLDDGVAAMRRAIDEARRRGASVAQRAVLAALGGLNKRGGPNGGSTSTTD